MINGIIKNLPSVIETLKNEKLPVFLYGMGNGAEKIYAYLKEHGIEIKGIVASDGFARNNEFLGFTVISISEASALYGKLCLVLCFGLEGEKSRFLYELAKQHKLISPNLPVFGNGACDKSYISENIEKFNRVYELLADEQSKEIFLNLIKYNITGDIGYLVGNNGLTPPNGFYSHNKRHIDIGAYDGDTVNEFVQFNNKYWDIIAFEPDKVTFKHFCENTKNIRNCIGINGAAGQKNGKIAFASGNGRASHCGEGENLVDVYSVDEYCGFTHIKANGIPVGSIKIDAEGMDEEAFCGAVNTIYCCKPNIAIALYHRAQDLIELPLLIRKHNSKYKLYLRKKEYVPAWDIFLYAIQE